MNFLVSTLWYEELGVGCCGVPVKDRVESKKRSLLLVRSVLHPDAAGEVIGSPILPEK